MEEEKRVAQKRKLNMKLYPIYKMISTDVLFFVAVKVLFLTQIKHISNANVVLLESFYAFFKMTLQIPMAIIVSKLGNRKSVIIGNIFCALELIIMMLSSNYILIVLSQLFSAVGWSIRSIAESPFLNETIPETKNKSKIFTKIDSKGFSKYCYISAITTLMSGFLYEINPYIPIILATSVIILELIISLNFVEISKSSKENKTLKQSVVEVKDDFLFILKSNRLKSLLIMIGFIWGLLVLFKTYQNTLLKDINIQAKYIGIIIAILEILQGMASTKANSFNNKFKNKSLTVIALGITLGAIVAGSVVVIGLPRLLQIGIILFTCVIRECDRGFFQIIKRKYIGNFMTQEMLTKVYSAYSIMASLSRMIITAIGSFLLTIMTTEYAMIVTGLLFTVITILLSIFIKTKVGLQTKQYDEHDVLCMK